MKRLTMLLVLLFTSALIIGCSSSDEGSSSDSSNGDDDSTKYEFIYTTSQPADHPMNRAGEWMGEELEKRTDGQVTVEVYSDSVLGAPQDLIHSLEKGDVDFAWITSAALASYIEEFNLFNATYVIEDKEQYEKVFFNQESDAMKELDRLIEEADIGSQMVGMIGGGLRHFYNTKRPIEQPEDLKGITIRIQDSKVHGDSWSALGANPAPLDFSEVFTGLQSGVVDAAESSLSAYETNKFFEVANYLSLTGHEFNVGPMMMSNKNLEELPEDLQEIVLEVAFEAGKKSTEYWWEDDETLIDELKEHSEINEVDVTKFMKLAEPVIKETAESNNATELYEKIINQE